MARITVEDCLDQANRFELVLLATRRTKQLLKGARPLVNSDNKEVVTALREIADGRVRFRYPEEDQEEDQQPNPESKDQITQTTK